MIIRCVCLMLLFISSFHLYAQDVKWTVLSPLTNTTVAGQNLFISVQVNKEYVFPANVKIFLDKKLITGNLKIYGNKLSLLYTNYIKNGKHTITVAARFHGLKGEKNISWDIVVSGKTNNIITNTPIRSAVVLNGTVVVDNRNEFLSGSGQDLRQEPPFTRTLTADVVARYKDAEIPLKVFLTSDNNTAFQSRNYFEIGFRNKWLEVDVGDMNPVYDKLILTGIRVRGIGLKLKHHGVSLQFCYGQVNKAYEGSLQTYAPGSGIVPTNLVNDSQYISPGIYSRYMMAMRLEIGSKRDVFKIGATAFKAKDNINSIQYGLLPKDNIAGGMDMTLKLFRKSLIIQSGFAGSVLTNDISYGVANKGKIDTTFNIKLDFDPKQYQNIIILNTSTIPPALLNTDFISYYGQLNYAYKNEAFSFEYRRNGPTFNSLGNPFLLTNYEGYALGEKYSFFNKVVNVDIRYRNYSNDLNASLPSKIYTTAVSGNIFVNAGRKWPVVMFNYLSQSRDSKTEY